MLHGMLLTGRGRTGAKERESQNKKTTLGRTDACPTNNEEHISERVARFKKKKRYQELIGCSKIICVGLSDVPVWEWRRYQ